MWLGSSVAVAVVYRPAAAALIQPLAWELPYATGVALKRKKKKQKPNNSFYTFNVLFSSFSEVLSTGGNYVSLEPLELSLTLLSFISFILSISESSRALKGDLYRALPPYSNLEPHPSSLADQGSL